MQKRTREPNVCLLGADIPIGQEGCIRLLWLPQQATTDRWLRQQTFISQGPGGCKSKIKVQSGLVSGESASWLAGGRPPAVHPRGERGILGVSSSSFKVTSPVGLPPPMILCNLIISSKAPTPNTDTLRVRASTYEGEGRGHNLVHDSGRETHRIICPLHQIVEGKCYEGK